MAARRLIGLVHNALLPESGRAAEALADSLGRESCWIASAGDLLDVDLSGTSVIVTAGGDGTILRAVRAAAPHSIPILGVNLGRVGFMTELSADEAAEKIPSYLDGSRRVEERAMLRATVQPAEGESKAASIDALNDVVVSRGAVPRLLDIDVRVDGVRLITYRADGVIIATATGSTGYALSAGGPIMYPEARDVLVQPLAAHMSLQSGIVVPGESEVQLSVKASSEFVLTIDGHTDTELTEGDVVRVERSPYVARFLRADPPAASYSSLTRKLGVRGLADRPGDSS
jgi:NAD+ kinase